MADIPMLDKLASIVSEQTEMDTDSRAIVRIVLNALRDTPIEVADAMGRVIESFRPDWDNGSELADEVLAAAIDSILGDGKLSTGSDFVAGAKARGWL